MIEALQILINYVNDLRAISLREGNLALAEEIEALLDTVVEKLSEEGWEWDETT